MSKDDQHAEVNAAAEDPREDSAVGARVGSAQAEPIGKPKLGGKAVRDIALYGLWRIVLFLALTFLIHSIVILLGMASFFPLLISAMLALLLALPLSMVLFKNLRLRATKHISDWDAGRRAHKLQMRKQLEERLG